MTAGRPYGGGLASRRLAEKYTLPTDLRRSPECGMIDSATGSRPVREKGPIMAVRNLRDIRSTLQLRDVANELGSPFFSRETMRYFGSRLSDHLRRLSEDHGYFVTSERDPQGIAWDGERRYSVRSYRVTRSYDEHGTPSDAISFDTIHHGEHSTMRAAVKAMNAL